jgi:hypothetical protein
MTPQWSVAGGQWSVVGGQWSVVGGRWSVVGGRWPVVGGQWSVVSGWPSTGGAGALDRWGRNRCSECGNERAPVLAALAAA